MREPAPLPIRAMHHSALLGLGFALLPGSLATAQTIVTPGDDLAAIVAAAPDGEVIRIDSDGVFIGTLSWEGKALTLEAGPGFSPTVQGGVDLPALALNATGGVHTSASVEGLTLKAGPQSDPLGPALDAFYGTTPDDPASHLQVRFVDCEFEGEVDFGSFLDGQAAGEFEACGFSGMFFARCRGASTSITLSQGCEVDGLFLVTSTAAIGSLTASDCRFSGLVQTLDLAIASDVDVLLERCLCREGILVNGLDSNASQFVAESCMIVAGPQAVGFYGARAVSSGELRLVNCTVSGFPTGVSFAADGASSAENLLVYGNTTADVDAPPGSVSFSLVADGSYTGSGTVSGAPLIDGEFMLSETSLGVDAGNDQAADIGSVDFYGKPRIQDGDEDGTPRVNFGAVESVNTCGIASLQALNGSGINPAGTTALAPPILGQDFQVQIQTGVNTALTLLAIDAPSPIPFPLPGIQGEILLQGTPSLLLDFGVSPGNHQLPVPDDLFLCGATTGCQGLRVDLDPGTGLVETFALNGYRLTLGN